MNQNSCPPPREAPPGWFASLDDCTKVAILEEAILGLAGGKQRMQIRHGEYWVTYHAASVQALERMLNRYRALCGRRHGFTVGPQPVIGGGCDPFSNPRRWR